MKAPPLILRIAYALAVLAAGPAPIKGGESADLLLIDGNVFEAPP